MAVRVLRNRFRVLRKRRATSASATLSRATRLRLMRMPASRAVGHLCDGTLASVAHHAYGVSLELFGVLLSVLCHLPDSGSLLAPAGVREIGEPQEHLEALMRRRLTCREDTHPAARQPPRTFDISLARSVADERRYRCGPILAGPAPENTVAVRKPCRAEALIRIAGTRPAAVDSATGRAQRI